MYNTQLRSNFTWLFTTRNVNNNNQTLTGKHWKQIIMHDRQQLSERVKNYHHKPGKYFSDTDNFKFKFSMIKDDVMSSKSFYHLWFAIAEIKVDIFIAETFLNGTNFYFSFHDKHCVDSLFIPWSFNRHTRVCVDIFRLSFHIFPFLTHRTQSRVRLQTRKTYKSVRS